MKQTNRSVFRRGADDGLILGPLMIITVILVAASPFYGWMLIPAFAAIIAVPILSFYLIARGLKEDYPNTPFSATWMHGICMFLGGGIILALFAFIALRWWQPLYFQNLYAFTIDILQSQHDVNNQKLIDQMQMMIDRGLTPSPSDTAFELLYLVSFTGSILSLILALIARKLHNSNKSE
ncbi:MAG: DUF4199 domain-containing protein [Muribaculaceae bacterium]